MSIGLASRMGVTAVLLVWLTSCSTSGGPVLGLPVAASKNLKGSVTNNTYTSPGKDFSVALPYDESSDHWKYMMVREGNDGDNLRYVIFGPVYGPSIGHPVFDLNEYHVVYIKKPEEKNLSAISAEAIFQSYNRQAEQKYKMAVERVAMEEQVIGNHKVVYGVYKQTFPIGKSVLLKNTRHYAFYLMDLGGHLVNIVALMASEGNEQARTRETALISRKYDRFERLIQSFSELRR